MHFRCMLGAFTDFSDEKNNLVRFGIFISYGWFYKLALTDFDSIFEIKVQVREGAMRAL